MQLGQGRLKLSFTVQTEQQSSCAKKHGAAALLCLTQHNGKVVQERFNHLAQHEIRILALRDENFNLAWDPTV